MTRVSAVRSVLAALVLVASVLVATAQAQARAIDTVSYGPDGAQVMDIYRDDPDGPARPTLLLIHGGSWRAGSRTDVASQAAWWQSQGYTVASMDYRLSGTAIWPAPRADTYAAVAWLRAHATDYQVDGARIGLIGYSAGGHIAVAAGSYGSGATKVKVVVGVSPITSPIMAYQDGTATGASAARQGLADDTAAEMGCIPDQMPADAGCRSRWNGSNALLAAGPGDAPMYLIHSAGDLVPPAHGIQLCTALIKAGVPCVAQGLAGSAHGSALLTDTREQVLAWLTKML